MLSKGTSRKCLGDIGKDRREYFKRQLIDLEKIQIPEVKNWIFSEHLIKEITRPSKIV